MPSKGNPTRVPGGRTRDPALILAELERIDRQQKRLERTIARQEAEHRHRQAARRHLPSGFPEVAAAAGTQPALWPVGFRRELDPPSSARCARRCCAAGLRPCSTAWPTPSAATAWRC